MIWKTGTHQFSATICQRTGKTCPALARIARALATSMAESAPAATTEFEIQGSSELAHCTDGCTARFRARADEVRVFCGAGSDDAIEHLDSYADLLFGTETAALSTSILSNPPCAMLEVLTLAQTTSVQPEYRPSA